MSYKFVSEDEHTFTVRHPDGSDFNIAKNAVGSGVHKKIKELEPVKMAEGGTVPSIEDGGTSSEISDKDFIDSISKPSNPMAEYQNILSHYQNAGVGGISGGPEMRSDADYQQLKDLRSANSDSLSSFQAGRLKELEGWAAGQPTQPAPIIAGPAPASMVPSDMTAQPVASAPQAPSSIPNTETVVDANSFISPQIKAIENQQKITNAASSQIQNEFQKQALIQQKLANDVQVVDQNLNKEIAPWKKEDESLFNAIKDQKIDANRIWHNMGAGNKVLAAISIALSGIGSGLTGQKNMAMDVIDKTIDRDIEAQKADLGKKQTLFSENLRRIGDARTAAAVTKGQLITAAQAMSASSAARIGSADALQKNALMQQEAELKKAGLYRQGAMLKLMQDAKKTGGQSTDQLISYLRMYDTEKAKEMEGRYIPGVGLSSVPLTAEVRNNVIAKQQLGMMAKDLYNWSKNHSGSLDPETVAQGKTKSAELQSLYRNAINGGVFKKGEQEFIDTIVDSDPTKFFNNVRVLPKLEEIIKSNASQLNTLKRGYGLPVNNTEEPQTKTVGVIKYMRGPNGEAIRVK